MACFDSLPEAWLGHLAESNQQKTAKKAWQLPSVCGRIPSHRQQVPSSHLRLIRERLCNLQDTRNCSLCMLSSLRFKGKTRPNANIVQATLLILRRVQLPILKSDLPGCPAWSRQERWPSKLDTYCPGCIWLFGASASAHLGAFSGRMWSKAGGRMVDSI